MTRRRSPIASSRCNRGASRRNVTRLASIDRELAATQSVTPLEELYHKRIAQIEGRELGSGEEHVPHDRFQWALVAALACMLIEVGLRERVGRRARLRREAARPQSFGEAA